MSETALLQNVRLALGSKLGIRLWRNNLGMCVYKGGQHVRYGVANPGGSDLIGFKSVVVTSEMVGRTIAQLMHLDVADKGKLVGRVLSEALPGGTTPEVSSRVLTSNPASNGLITVLDMQMVGSTRYFDAAGFPGRTVGLSTTVLPNATTQ